MRWAAMLLVSIAVLCDTAEGHAAPAFGVEVFGAYGTYAMEQVNDELISPANAALLTNFDRIGGAFTGGGGIRFLPRPHWMVSAGWEPLPAVTRSDANDVSLKLDLHANALEATAAYFFTPSGHVRLGVGGGLARYSTNGEFVAPDSTGQEMILRIRGSAMGFHVLALGEWKLPQGPSAMASAGYRSARIRDARFRGVEDGAFEIDYSGLILRAGLVFTIGNPEWGVVPTPAPRP